MQDPFFIIGNESGGTHLLGTILDSHSRIAVGPELHLLNHAGMYGDFTCAKKLFWKKWRDAHDLLRRLQRRLFRPRHYTFQHAGPVPFFRRADAYYLSRRQIAGILDMAGSFRDLVLAIGESFLATRSKLIWGKKTLLNVLLLDQILTTFPDCKVVHLARDGRDATLSLTRRGCPKLVACGAWGILTASALRYENDHRYLRVSYEELVRQPAEVLTSVCKHLGVDFEENMLSPGSNVYWQTWGGLEYGATWTHKPTDGISSKSVGKYRTGMPEHDQRLFMSIVFTQLGKHVLGTPYSGNGELMRKLGYASSLGSPSSMPLCIEVKEPRELALLEAGWVTLQRCPEGRQLEGGPDIGT